MLWRFSFASNSTLDALLTRDIPPSLEEILDEQDILNECKAQNNKLVSYLSREESVKSLLNWVVAGLDELNQQAEEADEKCLEVALTSPDLYPSYKPSLINNLPVPGNGPDSPPLEPSPAAAPAQDLVNVDLKDEHKDQNQEDSGAIENDEFIGSDVGLGKGLRRKSEGEEELHRSRYPNLAAEILCCTELWSISETIVHNPDYLLLPFWDAVLPPLDASSPNGESSLASSMILSRQQAGERERARNEFWNEKDEERDRRREVIRGMWMRVNGVLMTKRTPEMIRFIRSIPNIVERIVARIASPAVQDILIRIVSSEEGGVTGVIDWLADEGLIPRLIEFLSPHYSTSVHTVVAEILKSIITLCAPTPFNPHGGNAMEQQAGQGQTTGARDNRLIRELISETNISTLIGFMLDDIELTDEKWEGLNGSGSEENSPSDPFITHPLPSIASATSSLSHICSILVEVIRRNNSDFSEPHLFHTLRNRLMSVRMQPTEQPSPSSDVEQDQGEREEKDRKRMEDALGDMSASMGIVHLGHLLDIISQRFDKLHRFVKYPRSQNRSASAAQPKPFTLERFRILELYAELLHSSNMSIFNRIPGTGPTYTEEGILSGGLEGLEALGEAIDGDQAGEDDNQIEEDQVTQAKELPVSCGSTDASLTGSEEEVASEDEEMLENIDVDDVNDITPSNSPAASKILELPKPSASTEDLPPPPSPADAERLRDVMEIDTKPSSLSTVSDSGAASNVAIANSTAAPSIASSEDTSESITTPSNENNEPQILSQQTSNAAPPLAPIRIPDDTSTLAPGDKLKRQYVLNSVIPTVVDLFFEYPNNDFMHHVVYDILQQILNGRLAPGLNNDLVVELIVKARLVERVIDAQRVNDRMVAQPRCPRLPYMGHIILISEELVKFFARCPPELYARIKDSFVLSEWEEFVENSLREAKIRDTKPLAGGKPMSSIAQNGSSISENEGISSGMGVKRDDDDSSSDEDDEAGDKVKFGEPLTRTSAQDGFINRGGGDNDFDDFGDDEEGMDRFWRNSGVGLGRRPVDSSDDDDDADWLQPTANAGWGNNAGGDDDDFGAWETAGPSRQGGKDDFDDDDGWGNFNSGSPAFASPNPNAEDPFGDDNFVPSVVRAEPPAPNQANEIPLTPRDWAEQFDRAFREGGESTATGPDENGVTAIVVPNMDDDDDEESEDESSTAARRMSMSAGTSSWTFAGDDEGVDLPPTESPTIPEIPGFESAELPRVASTIPKEAITSPQPVSPIRHGHAISPSSTSPITSPQAVPINIPRRKPSYGHGAHPGHPSGSLDSSDSSSSSPRNSKWQTEAFSPPDPSLIAAATEDSPLGPGVSPDTKITDHGLLEREVDGRKIRVPQDEIVEAIERAQDDSAEQ
ncbi:hypothetical protein I203_104816 [Kwoniella mangroviensis CBS 8507]|uniref:uncharacterized protein n=1 Tax=Kwoniella mangroviensis CBS 8507 TaxID=1296122 RepID=UPI00080CC20D|nr:uncharacterized protein I203_00242 [Kwoniella mangroviensis CBS 8507]OCF70110.1 hypothetical protein I203_00242 [Kwoniella mangroviensis CBS 8507]